ncbi:MAG: tRNA lysidine(34) synthetase TilS [Arthrobacter sp.]|nr:tRNA lysidine(34) synthetase TilS [Micrococcaceae bacterium]MDN5904425.1 tRNA lysidine(34) synthetase TilS [Micrococcaceae bacterium]
MGGHLPPALARARRAILDSVGSPDPQRPPAFVLIGCSGGADSLALAAAAAFLVGKQQLRAGAVIVDHGLQSGSADVAETAATQLRGLGLEPVLVRRVAPEGSSEADARRARYAAFDQALADTGASALLLGHTLDDQAEQVLLGLARGSGPRSLAGMPASRGPYLRPLLRLRRTDTEAICAHEGLEYWVDPSNADTSLLRNRVRHELLPLLEDSLGPGLSEALARTAILARRDADHLDAEAAEALARLRLPCRDPASVLLDLTLLRGLGQALLGRVLRSAVVHCGAPAPGFERVAALEQLVGDGRSAGPIQLDGHARARRHRRGTHPETARAVIAITGPGSAPTPGLWQS